MAKQLRSTNFTKNTIKVLLLEDDPLDAGLVERELLNGGIKHEILVVNNKAKFKQALKNYPADIILSDHSLLNFDSHEALRMIKKAQIKVPFILITAAMTDEYAVNIMKEGANDYILKDRLLRLPLAVTNALKLFRLEKQQTVDRDKATADLSRLNHRLQLATQSASLGIWDWNIEDDTLEWDEGMYLLYGITEQEFGSVYDGWISKLHPEDRDRINEELQAAVTDGVKYDTHFRIIKAGDNINYIRATGMVQKNSEGKAVRMIGINWDITKRILDTQEREHILNEMIRHNAELEQFAYIISHNLRAPVANIIGASSTLTDPDLTEEDKQILTKGVHESALSLDNIIKDLNNIIDVKSGIKAVKEVVRFSELVEDIKFNSQQLLISCNIKIKCDFTEINEMLALKPYLYSIFYNLIANSIKYRQQHISSTIEIKSRLNGKKIELYFIDNGLGINLEKQGDKIFGLYKRFHPNIPGKGMGLFMVKTQVEVLGGKVTLNSKENHGTEFRIEFDL